MAHHKRGRPKHRRAGCLLCKPHKDERAKKRPRASTARKLQDSLSELAEGRAWS
jgi:hypothetical protein